MCTKGGEVSCYETIEYCRNKELEAQVYTATLKFHIDIIKDVDFIKPKIHCVQQRGTVRNCTKTSMFWDLFIFINKNLVRRKANVSTWKDKKEMQEKSSSTGGKSADDG